MVIWPDWTRVTDQAVKGKTAKSIKILSKSLFLIIPMLHRPEVDAGIDKNYVLGQTPDNSRTARLNIPVYPAVFDRHKIAYGQGAYAALVGDPGLIVDDKVQGFKMIPVLLIDQR